MNEKHRNPIHSSSLLTNKQTKRSKTFPIFLTFSYFHEQSYPTLSHVLVITFRLCFKWNIKIIKIAAKEFDVRKKV